MGTTELMTARTLRPFLTASIVVHLSVLASVPAAYRIAFPHEPTASTLAVTLQSREESSSQPVSAIEHNSARLIPAMVKHATNSHTATAKQDNASSDSVAADETTGQAEPSVSAASTAPVAGPASASESALRGEIELAIAQYFHYPALARREGWQGSVQVGLTILDDGLISDVRVTHSSGYAVLDRAATNALNEAARIRNWLHGQRSIELPIHYQLADAR
jgi:TonB family protein